MLSQVKKNTINPKGILYHSLIKLLILDQLKKQKQSWDTFVFKVLNPLLNIWKHPRHIHNHESSQSPSLEKKNTNVVHLDDDTSEAITSTRSTPIIPVSAKFVPLSRPRTRFQKEKYVQSIAQSSVQTTV